MTAVHPAARAAASLRVIMAEGKFHGVRIELCNTRVGSFYSFRETVDVHDTCWSRQQDVKSLGDGRYR